MISSSLLRDTVTVLRRGESGTDRYGKAVFEYVEGETVKGRFIYPSSREETTKRDALVDGMAVIVRPGLECSGRDRLMVNGLTYEVIGNPIAVRQAFGPGVLKIRVQEVEG